MNKKLVAALISGLALGGASYSASAETPSFDYIELGYTQLELDDADGFDPDGYEFDFNYSLSKNIYMNVDYSTVDEFGIKLKNTNIGLGYKTNLSSNTAFFAQLDWAQFEAGAFGMNEDDDGYKASFGVRSNVTENLELNAAYERLNIDGDTANIFVFGGAYKLSDSLALYADYKTESDFDQTSVGLKFSF